MGVSDPTEHTSPRSPLKSNALRVRRRGGEYCTPTPARSPFFTQSMLLWNIWMLFTLRVRCRPGNSTSSFTWRLPESTVPVITQPLPASVKRWS